MASRFVSIRVVALNAPASAARLTAAHGHLSQVPQVLTLAMQVRLHAQPLDLCGRSLKHLFRLSDAEVVLAALLRNGLDPKDIAKELELSINTVRSRLKSIYVKTGANRQALLVSLLDDFVK